MKTTDYKFNGSNNTLSHTLNVYFLSILSSMQVRTVTNSHISPLKIKKNTRWHFVLMFNYILPLSFWRYVHVHSRFFEITNTSTNSFPCVQWHSWFIEIVKPTCKLHFKFHSPRLPHSSCCEGSSILTCNLVWLHGLRGSIGGHVAHSVYWTATRPTED